MRTRQPDDDNSRPCACGARIPADGPADCDTCADNAAYEAQLRQPIPAGQPRKREAA